MAPRALLSRNSLAGLIVLVAILGLCSFQFGDRHNLNSLPFDQVRRFASNSAKAQQLAKRGNIDLLAGNSVRGESVRRRGEFSDGNCYFASHSHAYDHAFCAKLCLAAGSPLIFVSDQGGQIYFVLTPRNVERMPNENLNSIGVPGITARGKVIVAGNTKTFAVEALDKSGYAKADINR
jgi:hypothetical protein